MKNMIKLIGIIALVAVIGFSFASCGDGGGGDGGGGGTPPLSIPADSGGTPEKPVGNIYIGGTLAISNQQVYTASRTAPNLIYSFTPYTGNLKVYEGYYDAVTHDFVPVGGEIGAITNGRLSFSIGTPGRLLPFDASIFGDYYDNIKASENGVNYSFLNISASPEDFPLGMGNSITSVSGKTYVDFDESVGYIYVNKDVTITGKGKTGTETTEYGKTTYTVSDLNLSLKTGWNAIYSKEVDSGTFSGTSYLDWSNNTYNSTYTSTVFLSNPSLRWVSTWSTTYYH